MPLRNFMFDLMNLLVAIASDMGACLVFCFVIGSDSEEDLCWLQVWIMLFFLSFASKGAQVLPFQNQQRQISLCLLIPSISARDYAPILPPIRTSEKPAPKTIDGHEQPERKKVTIWATIPSSSWTAKMTGSRRTTPAPLLPVIRSQAAMDSPTATTSYRQKNLEVGATTAIFAFSILLGWLCLPKEAKHPANGRLTASLLLSFATFLSGNALMLLSFNMLGLREQLISSSQRVAAEFLRAACPVMSVLTLLSLLAFLSGRVYLYVGLAFMAVIMPVCAVVHCYLRYRAQGGAGEASDELDKKLEAASKITSCVTYSAFGGIVGVLFSVSKISAEAGGAVDTAAYSAIFFMFATAILGAFVMTVSKKVPEISNLPCQRFFITGVRLVNSFLLCTLACAAFAAAFTVLQYRVFVAFAPLGITATVLFLLRHCVARRGGSGQVNTREENHEARIKEMEDIASKVIVASLGSIMSILGGWLGEKDHTKWGALDMFMVVLTSVFVSSFGFMVLAASPGAARERLAPVARVLIWSTVALFAATAVAVYGVEVSGVDDVKP